MYVPPAPFSAAPLGPAGLTATAGSAEDPSGSSIPLQSELKVRVRDLNVRAGRHATVTGALLEQHKPSSPGLTVELETPGRRGWRVLARTRTTAAGHFRITYVPGVATSEPVRLDFPGNSSAAAAHRRIGRLNAYRPVEASWYGGGGELACGGELTSTTMGVASKTLPCGTLVTLSYAGRMVRVPVVDRGPYVEGRELDLTEATKEVLGFNGVGVVLSTA